MFCLQGNRELVIQTYLESAFRQGRTKKKICAKNPKNISA
jgi:hypothetical protein